MTWGKSRASSFLQCSMTLAHPFHDNTASRCYLCAPEPLAELAGLALPGRELPLTFTRSTAQLPEI